MPSSLSSILNEMRNTQISILSLLTFALSDTRYYANLVKEQDVPQILDTISAKYLSVTNSWALAKAIPIYQAEVCHLSGPTFGLCSIFRNRV